MDYKFFNDSGVRSDEVGEATFHSNRSAKALSWPHRRLFAAIIGDAVRGALQGDLADQLWIFKEAGGGLRFVDLCGAMGVSVSAVRKAVRSGHLKPELVGKALVYRNGERSLSGMTVTDSRSTGRLRATLLPPGSLA